MNSIGVIAIGRNEGERLRLCLLSVVGRGFPVIYVDSASTDGSAAMARQMGAEVVDLDMSIPFSAARARNEGMTRLLAVSPNVEFVQMVDGDCEVAERWIDRAAQELVACPDAAVVCGRRRERFPNASVYNRLADIEWNTPIGQAKSCGGDAMFRISAFQQVGGYDNSVVAGEEPELCQRLREAGWTVWRIDADMTIHDSAMLRFSQWWKRSIRSGYGALDVATRFGRGPDGLFVKQVRSARRWTTWLPTAIVCVGVLAGCLAAGRFGWAAGVAVGIASGILVGLVLPAQMARVAWQRRRYGLKTAAGYGVLTMLGKWANRQGHRQYECDRRTGKLTRMIDYKSAT